MTVLLRYKQSKLPASHTLKTSFAMCRSASDHTVSLCKAASVSGDWSYSPLQVSGSDKSCPSLPSVEQLQQRTTEELPPGNTGRLSASHICARLHSTVRSPLAFAVGQAYDAHRLAAQNQTRGYQTVISPAARERLERLSQRHEELCQQLSGDACKRLLF